MGVHTGEPRVREGEYWGPDVHYAARLASAARGGQVLVSAATAALTGTSALTSLGRHRLKDFPEPRELFAVGPGPHPRPRTLDPLRTNLPSAPTPLVGRDREVDEIARSLLGEARLVTVVGAGGTGKTRVGLAVADRLLDELPDGAFLIELAETGGADGVAGTIASVLGVPGGVEQIISGLSERELDGSLLAIELAAARLSLLTPEELLDRLRRSPDALGTGGRNLPERQRGRRAAMQWSYGLLDSQAATVFRRLGHFAGEASLERIEQVCDEGIDDVLESLARLVDLSLVRRTRDGRFELASALRTYSRELLLPSGESDTLNTRHADAIIAERLPLAIEEPLTSYGRLLEGGMAEQADLVALLDWAVAADRGRFRQIIACSCAPLNLSYGLWQWQDALEAEAAADQAAGRIGTLIQIAARQAANRRGGMLALARAADTEEHVRFHSWLLGTCTVVDALYLDADSRWMEQARAVVAELTASRDPDVLGLAQVVEGHLMLLEGRFDEAAGVFDATVGLHHASWAVETGVYMLGDCHLYAGRPEQALVAYARGAADARERTARVIIAFQGEGIAAALADLGRHEEALEVLGASDTLAGVHARPRDQNPGWEEVMAPRIAAARANLGDAAADTAYARGNGLSTQAVVELLLSYGAAVTEA